MKRIGCLWRNPVCEMGFIFWLGGGGYFWKVVVGLHRPRHLIFTLFHSNVYKVNVRLAPWGFMS